MKTVLNNDKWIQQNGHILDSFLKKIYIKRFTLKKKIGRFILSFILPLFDPHQQISWLNLIKKRSRKEKANIHEIYFSPDDFYYSKILLKYNNNIEYPNNKNFYIGITLDIDHKEDYKQLPEVINILDKYNIKATINFITAGDFKLNQKYIKQLSEKGFEIGLHGDTHNPALAFLPKQLIKSKLIKAVENLGFKPYGFRAPALSFSKNLILVLNEMGFIYDSSLTTGITTYKSIQFPYVFKLPKSNLFEIPLFIQDFNFFAGTSFTESLVFSIFKKLLKKMEKVNGVAVLNFHPVIISRKKTFFINLLQYINKSKTAYHNTLINLIKYYQ